MTSSSPRRSSTPPSEAADSRERILAAAAAEFRQKGRAGARVDEIARLSGCNKNLIYYYFGDKAGLYAESLKRMVGRSHVSMDVLRHEAEDLLDWLRLQARPQGDPDGDWRRLWLWEAIDGESGEITLREERAAAFQSYVGRIAQGQEGGDVRPDLDPAMASLALIALANFPAMFPQLAELITGQRPDDPVFERRQDELFVKFAAFLTATVPED